MADAHQQSKDCESINIESSANVASTNSDHNNDPSANIHHQYQSRQSDVPEMSTQLECNEAMNAFKNHYQSSYQSYPNSDSSLLLEKLPNHTLIDRAFNTDTIQVDRDMEREDSLVPHQKTTPFGSKSTKIPFRYSGQFTEKFYRTHSQPTLYEQLNFIDCKLKRSAMLPPLSHEDLPFADSNEDLCISQPNISPPDKVFNAPVANINDI